MISATMEITDKEIRMDFRKVVSIASSTTTILVIKIIIISRQGMEEDGKAAVITIRNHTQKSLKP
jgi:hypothetical protein